MRSFEVPGVGGIGLFPDTPDHRTYFTDKKDIFLFKDLKECVNLAQHLLQLSKAEANVIRQNARQYSVVSGYHYKDRAKVIVQYLQSLYEGNKRHTASTYSSIHENYEL